MNYNSKLIFKLCHECHLLLDICYNDQIKLILQSKIILRSFNKEKMDGQTSLISCIADLQCYELCHRNAFTYKLHIQSSGLVHQFRNYFLNHINKRPVVKPEYINI